MTDERGRTRTVAKGSWVVGAKIDDAELLRQARAGSLSFQPMLAPEVGSVVTAQPARKQEATTYESIKKSAVATQRPDETEAQAITRWVGDNPAVYKAYRAAATPVVKGIRNPAMDRIERLAKAEQEVDRSLSREAAIARVASDRTFP
jgi:hypothetical protein